MRESRAVGLLPVGIANLSNRHKKGKSMGYQRQSLKR